MTPSRYLTPLAFALVFVGACASREHLTPTHGQSSRAIFHAQRVDPQAGDKPKPAVALDSEDARVISSTYRDSMAPKGKAAPNESSRLILVAPQPNAAPAPMPPPSVPASN